MGCVLKPAPTLHWDLLPAQGVRLPDLGKLSQQLPVNHLLASFHGCGHRLASSSFLSILSSSPHSFAPSHLLSAHPVLTSWSQWKTNPSEGPSPGF